MEKIGPAQSCVSPGETGSAVAEMGPPNAQASVAARDETALRREYCCADMQSSKCPASRHQIARQLQGSMSLIGTFRTWRDVRRESVMRFKADIRRRPSGRPRPSEIACNGSGSGIARWATVPSPDADTPMANCQQQCMCKAMADNRPEKLPHPTFWAASSLHPPPPGEAETGNLR